ncbi:MAG: GNAT family N-acetyltransferase [Pseudomonadota bacterium]
MTLVVRRAQQQDTGDMAEILNAIIEIGGTTAYREKFDSRRVEEEFMPIKLGISCFVAISGTRVSGFQALLWSDPDWPGDDRLPEDWAVIATYVDPNTQKGGIGKALFAETSRAAKDAGVRFIDATIRNENTGGQKYYQGMGFSDYRSDANSVSKKFAPD